MKNFKRSVKKLVLSNKITRYLFGLSRMHKHKELLHLSYDDYLNEDYQKVSLGNGNTMCLYKSDKKADMYVDHTAYNDILNFIWEDGVGKANVLLDLGANYGQFILHPLDVKMSSSIISILAFEPNPKIAKALKQSMIESDLDSKVQVIQKGVSNEAGSFTFYINLYSSGGSSINPDNAFNPGDGIFRKKIEIETVRLDDFVVAQGIDFSEKFLALKIDVEGHDFHAFEGAVKLLEQASGFLMIMETTRSAAKDFIKRCHGSDALEIFSKNSFYVTYQNKMFEVSSFDEYLKHFDVAPGCIDIVLSSLSLDHNHYTQRAAQVS